jgi:hypothetical protein|tara:strand:+ start:9928 stop:10296 length:369 start_codon:yes stop_codon:yes gene_type:complete
MVLDKNDVLDRTNGGLSVFEHFIKGFPGPNKAFLNPLYDDHNPSVYVFRDPSQFAYRFIDFGNDSFYGDCFTYVGLVFGKVAQDKDDFIWILKTINHELSLGLEGKATPNSSKNIPVLKKKK